MSIVVSPHQESSPEQPLNMSPRTSGGDGELPPFMPDDMMLPFFAYGLFKPGQPLFRHIEGRVDGITIPATIRGSLRIRDGLPLLDMNAEGTVFGSVIRFKPGQLDHAYAEIGKREPRRQYRWEVVNLADRPELVNVLVGRSPDKGSVDYEVGEWYSAEDALLRDGLALIGKIAEKYASAPFKSAPPESFEWDRFFTLQMTYLFLWTVIERYAALAYGPDLAPTQKVNRLGQDRLFGTLLQKTVQRERRLFDAQDPNDSYRLHAVNPGQSAKYYFQVRNNLIHRGKGAWQDAETVRQSLQELLTIVSQMIEGTPGLHR